VRKRGRGEEGLTREGLLERGLFERWAYRTCIFPDRICDCLNKKSIEEIMTQ